MIRSYAIAGALIALVGSGSAAAQTNPGHYQDFGDPGGFLNIVPPGADGVLNATEAVQAEAGTYPPHVIDQLGMYGNLVYNVPGLDESRILQFFKDASFGVRSDDIARTYAPTSDVTVIRDASFGVPHIFGTTRYATMFAQGYTGAEDRLFLMDVLRHLGRARLSEFLGASPANEQMDRGQLAIAPYEEADLTAQVQDIANSGPEGQQGYADLLAYADGVNQYINEALTDPTKLPAEYPALQQTPAAWKPEDAVAIASLVGGIFGKGGGGELTNLCGLKRMATALGDAATARAVFDDLHFANDVEAPTTSRRPAPYLTGLGPTDPAAHPDVDCDTLVPIDASGPPLTQLLQAISAGLPGPLPHSTSNALLVSGAHTQTRHPIAVFGPQTSYYMPQLLVEKDVHGPGIDARGVAFAGTDLYVELGRGRNFAFSATSASSDNVDQWVLQLCEPGGGPPTVNSLGYLRNGICEPIESYQHMQIAKPSAGGIPGISESGAQCANATDDDGDGVVNDGCPAVGLPEIGLQCLNAIDDDGDGVVNDGCPPVVGNDIVLSWPVQRTAYYGPLVARGRLTDGTPIAIATLRSTYRSELASARGFQRVNDPNYMTDGFASFRTAMGDGVDYTFNWFYVDAQDIGYQHSCKCPQRAPGVDPSLPAWGTGQWDWQGFIALDAQPWDLDPAEGYITSWNNKPAPQWGASDNNFSYGPVYRSQMLDVRLEAAIAAGNVVRTGVIDAMGDAGTVDLRGQEDLPFLLDVLGPNAPSGADPRAQEMRDRLAAWVGTQTHRRDRDHDGAYDDPQSPAIIDAWWPRVAHAIFDGASGDAIDNLAITIDDPNRRNHIGSAFDDGMYSHVNKDLRQVLSLSVLDPWSRTYCGNGVLEDCRAALWASLGQAAADLQTEFGSANVADWRRAIADEDIRHTAVGITSVPAIEWINRPTFQQVVQLPDPTDPFKCYRAKPQSGTGGIARTSVDLTDEFSSRTMLVYRAANVCNAAGVDGQTINDPAAHLACYRIKAAGNQMPFTPLEVAVSNRFGANTLTLKKPWSLCVPSTDDGESAARTLDRFTCYRARVASGSPRFVARDANVQDEFDSASLAAQKPYAVCAPTNENGAGLVDRTAHLVCYQTAEAARQPRVSRRAVAIADEFGPHGALASDPALLCVPSAVVAQ